MIETINNGVIFLKRLSQKDSSQIYQAVVDSKHEIGAWLSWLTPEYDQNDADDFVKIQISNWNKKLEYTFTIKNQSGEFMGVIGLHVFDSQNDVASIGYWMHSKYTGQGFCTQALNLMVENALKPLNLIRIELIVAINNLASQRVVEKAGGTYEAVLKNRIRLNGSAVDAKVYAFISD